MLGTPQLYEYIHLSTCYKTYFLIFKYYIMKEKQNKTILWGLCFYISYKFCKLSYVFMYMWSSLNASKIFFLTLQDLPQSEGRVSSSITIYMQMFCQHIALGRWFLKYKTHFISNSFFFDARVSNHKW